MEKLTKFWNSDKRAYIYSLLFTVIIVIFLVAVLHIYPFGDHNFRYWDCDQYFAFYGYLQRSLFSKSNLLYSWSKVLGGDMLSTYAYYASSPFNLLLFFFQKDLPLGVNFIALLKTLLTSLNFCLLLNAYSKGNCVAKGLFSTSYAFVGYATYYAWNASWMDGVLFLPILVFGMRKMLFEHKRLLYILVLAISLISNFYIGYMLCIATVICYFIYLIEEEGQFWKRIKATFLRYVICSITAAGLSAWLLIPAYLGLPAGRRQSLRSLVKDLTFNFKAIDLFPMFYTGSQQMDDQLNNMPVVFVGIVPFVLLIAFWVNKEIRMRKKAVAGIACLIMFFSLQLSAVNIAWHGFSDNAGFNYRYSFIFSFLLLLIAYYSFIHYSAGEETGYITAVIFLAGTAILFYPDRADFSAYTILLDVLCGLLSLYFIRVLHARQKWKKAAAGCLLSGMVLANIAANSWSFLWAGVDITSVAAYRAAENTFDSLTGTIQDGDFYRIANCNKYGRCDASQFNYAGVADYASTENPEILKTVRRLGMEQTWLWSAYGNANTPESTDDLLGLRYILSSEEMTNKNYRAVAEKDGVTLYQNEKALPLIYPVSTISDASADPENDFAFVNAFWHNISEEVGKDVFAVLQPDVNITPTDSGEDIDFAFQNIPDEQLYMQVPEVSNDVSVQMFINGEEKPYSSYQEIYYLGNGSDIHKVSFHVGGDMDASQICFAVEDIEAEQQYLAVISDQRPEVIEKTSSYLTFDSNQDEEQIYASSIPFDESWEIQVDGAGVSKENNLGFLAFSVPGGKHTVSLKYHPKGLQAGILVSVVMLTVLIIYECRRRMAPGNRGCTRQVDQ